jgi:hypothetical protein
MHFEIILLRKRSLKCYLPFFRQATVKLPEAEQMRMHDIVTLMQVAMCISVTTGITSSFNN